jgi:hypothetical protein
MAPQASSRCFSQGSKDRYTPKGDVQDLLLTGSQGDTETPSQCEPSRTWLKGLSSDFTQFTKIINGTEKTYHNWSEAGRLAAEHIQNCELCQDWYARKTGEQISARQGERKKDRRSRMQRYCCVLMYAAVEENSPLDIRLRLRGIRGENLWTLFQPDRQLGFVHFSYCPWCGEKLSEEPFIDDEVGWG